MLHASRTDPLGRLEWSSRGTRGHTRLARSARGCSSLACNFMASCCRRTLESEQVGGVRKPLGAPNEDPPFASDKPQCSAARASKGLFRCLVMAYARQDGPLIIVPAWIVAPWNGRTAPTDGANAATTDGDDRWRHHN